MRCKQTHAFHTLERSSVLPSIFCNHTKIKKMDHPLCPHSLGPKDLPGTNLEKLEKVEAPSEKF